MKKVEKVSIAEISFTLDSDAYVVLKQYLDSLNNYYDKDPDGREIIADIEARIAELILDEQIYTKVVSKPLVDTIIAQLGTPDQIDDEVREDSEGAEHAGGSAGFPGSAGFGAESSIPRRLHRSTEGRVLGGVCSGLAKYLDINVAWVRLAFLFPIIFRVFAIPFRHWHWLERFAEGWGWVFFVIYIVLWIALPMARTPRQKLEARGEKITPASIRQNMQDAASTPAGRKASSVAAELFTVVGRVVLFFVKFVMAVIGFSIMFAAVLIFMIMATAIFTPDSICIANNVSLITVLDGMSVLSPVLFMELTLLCVLFPLTVMGMALLSFTFSWKLGRVFYGVTLGTWALAMIFLGIVSASNIRFFHDVLPDRIEKLIDVDIYDRHHKRVKIREVREAFEDAEGLSIDVGEDSVRVVVKKNGIPDDTIVISEKRDPVSITISASVSSSADSVASEVKDDVKGSRRVEIRRIE